MGSLDNGLSIAASIFTIASIVFAGFYFKDLFVTAAIKTKSMIVYKLITRLIANKNTKEIEKFYTSFFNFLSNKRNSSDKFKVKEIYLYFAKDDLNFLYKNNYKNLLLALRYMSDRYVFSLSNKKVKFWNKIFTKTNKIINNTEKYRIWNVYFKNLIKQIEEDKSLDETRRNKKIKNIEKLQENYLKIEYKKNNKNIIKILSLFGFNCKLIKKDGKVSIEINKWNLPLGISDDREEIFNIFKILTSVKTDLRDYNACQDNPRLKIHGINEPEHKNYCLDFKDTNELKIIKNNIYQEEIATISNLELLSLSISVYK